MFRLDEKNAIVSGGSKGIGKAIAIKFAQAGANVIICSRQKENLDAAVIEAESNGLKLFPIECNTSNYDSILSVTDYTLDKFGKVDILVNNAATNPYMGSMLNMPIEKFDKVMNNNIKSNQILCNLVLPEMIDREDGSIIIISSIAAIKGPKLIIISVLATLVFSRDIIKVMFPKSNNTELNIPAKPINKQV